MNKKEAMKILATGNERTGFIDGAKIIVTDTDIASNLEMNDYELDLEFIQDLTKVLKNGDYEMYQGHSLAEVKL